MNDRREYKGEEEGGEDAEGGEGEGRKEGEERSDVPAPD